MGPRGRCGPSVEPPSVLLGPRCPPSPWAPATLATAEQALGSAPCAGHPARQPSLGDLSLTPAALLTQRPEQGPQPRGQHRAALVRSGRFSVGRPTRGRGTGCQGAALPVRGGGTGYLQLSCRDRTQDPLRGAPPSMSSPQESCPELGKPPGGAAFALCSHLLTWARLDTRSASLPEKLRGMVLGLGLGSRQPLSASSCSFLDPGATHPLPAQALGRAGGELLSWEHMPGTRGIVQRGRHGPPVLPSSLQVN